MAFIIIFSLIAVILLNAFCVWRYNEKDKRYVLYGGREFECYCSDEFSGRMCCVSIYEIIHPNRKIFRTKYRAYKTFWVSDYETIKEGVYAMIQDYLDDEAEAKIIDEKWAKSK